MRLDDLVFSALLPSWMRGDLPDLALSAGVDSTMREAAPKVSTLTVWDKVDELPEAYLDELAWALDIDWYDFGASVETKRDLVLNSDLVHMKLGTVSALESVVASYFGVGRVREWFDYAGEPHHFKVFTTDPSAVEDNLIRFLDMLEKVKRKSSKFDGIQIGLTGESTVHCGIATHILEREEYWLAWPPDPPLHIGPTGESTVHVGHATKVTTAETFAIGYAIEGEEAG